MPGIFLLSSLLLFQLLLSTPVSCRIEVEVPTEMKLREELLGLHNMTVRPVKHFSERLYIYLRFRLLRVAELDVKDQLLTLNVEIEQEWTDYKFQWDPDLYDGIRQINLPAESVWRPDFQLYNQFGEFQPQSPNIVAYHNGVMKWTPSAILKSFCPIEVRYYPFDIQTCLLNFGSWSYDGNLLYIALRDLPGNGTGFLPVGMTLKNYYPSAEWDLLSIPAICKENYYPCCEEPYLAINFNVTLRRHPHFYLVNLVMPLVGLSYLSLLAFYLPADSNEKITLCVSVLTSQVMFLLLMIDNIPITSLAVPLLGKIIVFDMTLVFLSVLCTTIVLNVYYRKPATHKMPGWVRRLRHSLLPKLLFVEVVPSTTNERDSEDGKCCGWCCGGGGESSNVESRLEKVSHLCTFSLWEIDRQLQGTSYQRQTASAELSVKERERRRALSNVYYVRNYMERLAETNYECEDWKFLASILDRIFLILFNLAFVIGTVVIMMDAPALYDNRRAVDKTLLLTNTAEHNYLSTNDSDIEGLLLDDQGVVFDE